MRREECWSRDSFNFTLHLQGYYEDMPWMAVPYSETTHRSGLGRRFSIMGYPTIVILSPEGHVVNTNARTAIIRDPEASRFPWEGDEERYWCCVLQ